MSQSISASVGTLIVGSEARKRMEAFFEQGEMLSAERIPRGGGVLLRDLPPLIGQGPQVILVQPRDLVEGWRHNDRKKKPKVVRGNGESGAPSVDNEKSLKHKGKSKSLQSISISPDFSKFLDRPEEEERFRGGHRNRSTPVMDNTDILNELVARKPSWNFESILKEIEEDSVMVHGSASSTTTEPCDTMPGPQDGFIEISLQGSDEVDCQSLEDRRSSETQEALSRLFDQLLADIYSHNLEPWCDEADFPQRRRSDSVLPYFNRSELDGHLNRQMSYPGALPERRNRFRLPVRCLSRMNKSSLTSMTSIDPVDCSEDLDETVLCENKLKLMPLSRIQDIRFELESNVAQTGKQLVVELEEKDTLTLEQSGLCEIVTASLQAISNKTSDDARVKFSLTPATHDQSGFQEWARAMRMVARLPDGVPTHFRKNLWLSLAERHLHTKGVSWAQTERRLFCDTTSAEDKELSVQIVKDLHRTGCSLFCGVTGQHNQAVLKRVLLAYARWNTNVGYCQGLNMLAALILQVMQGSQSATVKVMIYLIEGVLPESYFANNLRGLSVDMAVFRDLLRLKLPELSKHLDHLQQDSKDSGTSYEPPLCDVFTMQWFLTLFSNCLPQNTVLRVWDLVFLEGDQILLRTALAIWQSLSERMMSVRSADEFYSIMAVLTREMMEFGLMEPNSLIKAIDNMLTPEVGELREKYIYNISPWAVGTVAKMGVRLLYPDHGSPNHEDSYKERGEPRATPFSNHPDREKIALDISALKRQYWKLRERQRQAHIILSANDVSACRSEGLTTGSSPALNHLLLGKRALLSAKGRRIEGSVPTQDRRRPPQSGQLRESSSSGGREGQTMTWREARTRARKGGTSTRSTSPSSSSSSSSSTELCDSSDSEESGALGDADIEKATDGEKPTLSAPNQIPAESSRGTSPVECLSEKTDQLPDVSKESCDSSSHMDRKNYTIDGGLESFQVNTKMDIPEEPTPDSANTTIESISSRLSSTDLITALPCDRREGSRTVSPCSSNLQSIGDDSPSHSLVMSSHTADAPSHPLITLPEAIEHRSSSAELGLNDYTNLGASLQTSPISQIGVSGPTSSSYSTESASEGSTRQIEKSDKVGSSSYSSITKLDSTELDSGLTSVAPRGTKEMRKAPSSSQLGSSDVKWNRPPISSYSSIQLGAAVEPSKVPSSSLSSMQLGSGETSSTYSSLSSLPKDDTISSDWSKKIVEESLTSIADRSQKTGDSPVTSPEKSKTVEEKLKRRKSEIALLQILQENSQILQRIHQAHKITSPDEPEDIKDIRRRYGYRQSSSLDSPKTPKTTEGSPSPFIRNPSSLNRDVTIKLGMYPDRT